MAAGAAGGRPGVGPVGADRADVEPAGGESCVVRSDIAQLPACLSGDTDYAARGLLGCLLIRELDEGLIVARIVEVEAYDQNDPASHTFHGESKRNRAMFGPSGHAYIYFTYGMYHCFNITAGKQGFGSGVLIRAVEPLQGMDIIERRRGRRGPSCVNGPAKLCMALNIDDALYGHDLTLPPLQVRADGLRVGEHIESTTRIGISKAVDRRRRYVIAGNPYLSQGAGVAQR